MEALLLIFGEILFACLAPVLGLAGAALAGLLELLAAFFTILFGGSFGARKKRRAPARDGVPAAPRKPLIPRKVLHWTAGGLAGLGVLAVLGSVLFFQPILNYAMASAAAKAGMEVQFESASGMLLTGQVTLNDVHVIRDDPEGLDLDIRVARAQADVDLWTLLGSEPVITLAVVEGVTGYVSPPPVDKDKPKKKRRAFRADLVQAAGVDLEIRPKDSAPYDLVIASAELAPFRSRSALFDLLFRANMAAQIAGQDLIVETREITELGRETFWSFEDVEAEQIKLLVPKAPLTWLNGGTVSVRVDDKWSLSDDWIDMDWNIRFDQVQIAVPQEAGTTEKLLANTLAKAVRAQGGTADFRYMLSLDPEEVRALRSGDLAYFWDVVLSGAMTSVKERLPFSSGNDDSDPDDAVQENTDEAEPKAGAMDKLKGLFKRDKDE
ncbi:hypothetical protein [Roseovarius sp. 2305UL8-3]|uniref:hypothetical protein n=1 Tax=Roseovarius conchicola TaxID=3121636 RepID=UPI0035291D90